MERRYDPEGRWIQPDPSQADGLRTYVYADDDPVDETDALGLGGICDVPLFGGAACAVGALAHGAYDLVAGDDIKTLQDRHKSGVDKFLAVVDLTSNLLTFVPIGGEGLVAAKAAQGTGVLAHLGVGAVFQQGHELREGVRRDQPGQAIGGEGQWFGGEQVTGDDDKERHGGAVVPARPADRRLARRFHHAPAPSSSWGAVAGRRARAGG